MPRLRTEAKSPKSFKSFKRLGKSEFPRLRKEMDFHRKKNQFKIEDF